MPRYRPIDRALLKRRLVRVAELAADPDSRAAMLEVLRALGGDLQMPEITKALDVGDSAPEPEHAP